MDRFLAISRAPGLPRERFRDILAKLAEEAHARGIRPLETLYDETTRRAFTLFAAPDEAEVRRVVERAGLPDPEILPVERVFTELLDEPRRAR